MEKKGLGRKIILINKKFQFHLVGVFLGGILLSLVIFTFGIVGVIWANNNIGEQVFDEYMVVYTRVATTETIEGDQGPEEVEVFKTRTYLTQRYEIVIPPILINNLILLIILTIIGIALSHRLAGPIYRINKTIDAAVQGPLERPLSLRKKDFFHETAHKLNTLFKKVNIL